MLTRFIKFWHALSNVGTLYKILNRFIKFWHALSNLTRNERTNQVITDPYQQNRQLYGILKNIDGSFKYWAFFAKYFNTSEIKDKLNSVSNKKFQRAL